jgi:hypothetical protein
MQRFTFDTQVTSQISGTGRHLYYRAGNAGGGDASLLVRPEKGAQTVVLLPGQGVRFADVSPSWKIEPAVQGQRIIGELLIGDGSFEDNRVSGTVEVVDGAKNRTLLGGSFAEPFAPAVPLAGNFVRVGMYMPVGSTRRAVIKAVTVASQTAQGISVGSINAAPGGLAAPVGNKLIGSAFALQIRRCEDQGASLPSSGLFVLGLQASLSTRLMLDDPIILNPGFGVVFLTSVAATSLSGTIEGYEEPL